MKKNKLDIKKFAEILKVTEKEIPHLAKIVIKTSNFSYKNTDQETGEKALQKTFKTLLDPTVKKSGPHRKKDWEKGWYENYNNFRRKNFAVKLLIPKFVRGDSLLRLKGKFIQTYSKDFETNFVKVLRYFLFSKFLKSVDHIYEFGAGTGLNLVAAREIFPNKNLTGLDWAKSSCKIIKLINNKLATNINCQIFDLFNPDFLFHLDKNSGVFTIGTLEQLGSNFKPFIKYLLKNKPNICINVETLYELYDDHNLIDFLARRYLEKRNYLKGYLPYLIELEKKKRIKIITVNRTFGSFYHEGYSYVIWKPINN